MYSFSIYRLTMLTIFSAVLFFACEAGNQNNVNKNAANDNSTTAESNAVRAESDEYCVKVYDEVLEKYKQDYVSCLSNANVDLRQCPKPDGFDDGYKENLNIVIALDASGSMNGKIAGGRKMEIAKKAINNFVAALPERANVGLVVYGHKGSNSESRKQESCAGVEPIYPVGKLNKN